jgi:hypothetical protein
MTFAEFFYVYIVCCMFASLLCLTFALKSHFRYAVTFNINNEVQFPFVIYNLMIYHCATLVMFLVLINKGPLMLNEIRYCSLNLSLTGILIFSELEVCNNC